MSFDCVGCGETGLHDGGGKWDGRMCKAWGMMICNSCRSGGIPVPTAELLVRLKRISVKPTYNEDGSLKVPE